MPGQGRRAIHRQTRPSPRTAPCRGPRRWALLLGTALCAAVWPGQASAARIERVSPQGDVAQVRQVVVRFDGAVTRLGDLRRPDPMQLQCVGAAPAGQGRWLNEREWAYDFRSTLPPGVRCRLSPAAGWQPVDGTLEGPREFTFATGGPAVVGTSPDAGAEIEEDQFFLLRLNGPAAPDSVRTHAWCEVQGLGERLGVRVIEGAPRDAILQARQISQDARDRVLLLACQRPLPPQAGVRLVWGAGIAAAAQPQAVTRTAQVFEWRVRDRFTAEFSCERERADAGCLPLRPLVVRFSAPVARALAAQARLQPAQGNAMAPGFDKDDRAGTVSEIRFAAPLMPQARYTVKLPADLKDLAGRPLANAGSFPVAVTTGPLPPLAKFAAAPFGIVEWPGPGGEPAALPVTMRQVQADIAGPSTPGQVRIKTFDATTPDATLLAWIARLQQYHESELTAQQAGLPQKDWWIVERITDDNGRSRNERRERRVATRELGLLPRETGTTQATLPATPAGAQGTEVIGIPLRSPGYHVVEIESRLLGSKLLDRPAPMYVRTGALVTNLGVHFKRGRASSLVWVTTLDRARPVAEAEVAVNDCRGRRLWSGRTDTQGVARIPQGFDDAPAEGREGCLTGQGLFVTARRAAQPGLPADLAFVFSGWQQGIETWRFNQPTATGTEVDLRVHTVFDRTLLRAGETVSMKHFVRRETGQGLGLLPHADWPTEVHLTHVGSGEVVTLPLAVPAAGRSAIGQWAIPAQARLGQYEVSLHRGQRQWTGGSFRVEAFKVPLIDARLGAPALRQGPLVAPRSVALAAQLTYLSGGGVARSTASLDAMLRERSVQFAGFEDYSFQPPRERRGRAPEPDAEDVPDPVVTMVASRLPVTTDALGAASVQLDKLPPVTAPVELVAELTFPDPNGELQTVGQTLPLWPSGVVVGLRARSWLAQRGKVQFQAVVLDTQGRPQAGRAITVSGRSVQLVSSRKRLVGGFYAYDDRQEVKDLGRLCSGTSDARGLVLCEAVLDTAGEVELVAQADDAAGRPARASTSVWISGAGEQWFAQDNDDRIDVLPEQREVAPGQTARLQVRMPYRDATALVTVEREGILDARLVRLRGSDPVIELPIPGGAGGAASSWAPNVYVGVLVLRGRVREVPWYSFFQWGWRAPMDWWQAWRDEGPQWQPATAMIDLAKPSYKFGMAPLRIGLQRHRLDVTVTPAQAQYGVRQTARVRVRVSQDGQPAAGADVAFAAVDEALLALQPNDSWPLLEAMFRPRAWGVETATAQNEIIGRRHYGRKAVPAGGGGGRHPTRELFDTLLLWQPHVQLDARGEATLDVPLNDALTTFRLVALADAGADRFGSGAATVRVTQDLQLLPGLPAVVRQGDRYDAVLTLRNTTARAMSVEARLQAGVPQSTAVRVGAVPATAAAPAALAPQRITLPAGAAQEVRWSVTVPDEAPDVLTWQAVAVEQGGGRSQDRVGLSQRVEAAVPLRVLQTRLEQLAGATTLPVAAPADALPAHGVRRGGLEITVRPRLAGAVPGLRRYFETYPYSCLEQRASRALGLGDATAWRRVVADLPGYLDRDGLAQYFPVSPDQAGDGSDRLTAYLLSAAQAAGESIAASPRERMLAGLTAFVEGRIERRFPAPRADLDVRKLAALDALARHGRALPRQLGSLSITPAQWPTAALLDWLSILQRVDGIPDRAARLDEAQRLLRSRVVAGGTTLRFADEPGDAWWWLMDGPDANAARLLLAAVDDPAWQPEVARLVTGLAARLAAHRSGAFDTTPANLWATLALARFAALREAAPVTGRTLATLDASPRPVDWRTTPAGATLSLPWPAAATSLALTHQGAGQPWVSVQSLAAVPLAAPLAAGYRVERSVTAVEQKQAGRYSRGDVLRVRLAVEAQADLGWVVISDPVPAGATLLGSGLGRDAQIATAAAGGERRSSSAWLAYEERRPEVWRAYYRWLPRGRHVVEYTLRLNTPGRFLLPPSRVEAMYAPENFGESPNAPMDVSP